jgi:hypothetical protein
MTLPKICFFTCVSQNYEQYVLPFIYTHLINNKESCVEVVVEREDNLWNRYPRAKNFLESMFPGRYLIREFPKMNKPISDHPKRAATWRFVDRPKTEAEYTYLSDADILCLEKDIYEHELKVSSLTGLPFNNHKRKDSLRYTGCFAVKTKEYYSSIDKKRSFYYSDPDNIKKGDEELLYDIIAGSGFPDFDEQTVQGVPVRRIHGIHPSPNRSIDGSPGWGFNGSRKELYQELKKCPSWLHFTEVCDLFYRKNILEALESHS